jgi:tRNA nucleotidyltransferase (CCA-adding enzyme)
VVAREHGNIHRSGELGAAALVRLLERCDAIRKPARFAEVLLACECDARGRLGFEEAPYPQRQRLAGALAAAQSVHPGGADRGGVGVAGQPIPGDGRLKTKRPRAPTRGRAACRPAGGVHPLTARS